MKMQIWTMTILGAALASAQQDVVIINKQAAGPGGSEPRVMFFSSGGENVKGAPYSGDTITESVQTLADGNRITRTNKSSFARDGQGRTRRDTEIQALGPLGASREPAVSTFIDDPVAKVAYTLDARAKRAVKTTHAEGTHTFTWKQEGNAPKAGAKIQVETILAERMAERGANADVLAGAVVEAVGAAGPGTRMERVEKRLTLLANRENMQREDLGEKNIEGVVAKGTRTRMKIPAGEVGNEREFEVVTETWYSDQIKTMVYTKHSDPRFGETTTRMTNIKLGEPPASLFEVPPDYKIETMESFGRAIPRIVRE